MSEADTPGARDARADFAMRLIAAERRAERAEAEVARLEAKIRAVVETDEAFVAVETYRADGTPSKHDKCKHGRYAYEGCEACVCEFLSAALRKEPTP